MKVIMMSHKEFGRLRGFIDLEDGRISVLDAATPPRRHAATLAGFGRRQVYRVLASHPPTVLTPWYPNAAAGPATGRTAPRPLLPDHPRRRADHYEDFGLCWDLRWPNFLACH